MRGLITRLENKAKIDINSRVVYCINSKTYEGELVDEGDKGGYCEICKMSFSSVFELIDHFMQVHKGGDTV